MRVDWEKETCEGCGNDVDECECTKPELFFTAPGWGIDWQD